MRRGASSATASAPARVFAARFCSGAIEARARRQRQQHLVPFSQRFCSGAILPPNGENGANKGYAEVFRAGKRRERLSRPRQGLLAFAQRRDPAAYRRERREQGLCGGVSRRKAARTQGRQSDPRAVRRCFAPESGENTRSSVRPKSCAEVFRAGKRRETGCQRAPGLCLAVCAGKRTASSSRGSRR
jgi:hypothetical protein